MQLYRHLTANHIALQPLPFFREIAMGAYLIENPDVLALDEDELSDVSICEAELPMVGARKGRQSDGRIDLIATYGDSTVGILELKQGELNSSHLQQLEDYLGTIGEDRGFLKQFTDAEEPKLIGVLVGSSITSELCTKIENGYLFGDGIPIAALTLNRYSGSDRNVYVATDTHFRNLSRKFDRTKYLFDGQKHGKGRLVLAVIRKYAADHDGISYAELAKIFPKSLQGSSGCFETVDKAREIEQRDRKRHFLAADEVIDLKDASIAVSTQWGIRSIPRFIDAARSLGIKIVESAE